MKLLYKFLLLLAIPWLFQLMLFGVLYQGHVQAMDAERWALHTKRVITQATELLPPMLLQAAHVRGAVITKDVTLLDVAEAWDNITAGIDLLGMLVADHPLQVERIVRLRQEVVSYRAAVDTIRELIVRDKHDELVAYFRRPETGQVMVRFRLQMEEFVLEERQRDDFRIADLVKAQEHQQFLLMLAVVGSLLAAAVSVFAFSRSIGVRLATLTANAQRLAKGAPLAAKLGGKDEISRHDEVLHQTSLLLAEAEITALHYRSELEQRAIELGIVVESLRQQTQDNEMFIYSVSHDLRSPLVNLQGFSKEIMHACKDLQGAVASSACNDADRQRLNAIIDNDMAEALRFLQTAVLRTSNIIDALLRLSRAGRVDYQVQQVDVGEVATRVVDAMRATIKERDVEVLLHPLHSAWADPTAVEQIFGNLIGNAVCYLDVKRPGKIEIGNLDEADHSANLRTYYVKDNGLGISAAYLPKIFTAFQRFHGTVAKGEGIGLALVRRAVERHGGRTWVESTEGVGTTIFISLPAWETDDIVTQPLQGNQDGS